MNRTLAAIASVTLLALAACGGAQKPAAAATTAPAPALAQLPTDAWAVIADNANGVLVVEVAAVRGSPHGAFLRDWMRAALCLSDAEAALVLDRSDRIIAAQWEGAEQEPRPRGLIIASGAYTQADVATALGLTRLMVSTAQTPFSQVERGRFKVSGNDSVSAARIGEKLLVLGDAISVESALALAEGHTAPRLIDGTLLQQSGVRAELDSATAVLLGTPNERAVHSINRGMGAIGLPKDLLSGRIAAIARLDAQGVAVDLRIQRADPTAASAATDKVRARLGQVSLLARLAGLPPILERAQVDAEGDVLRARVTASHEEVAVLRERLRDLVGDALACAK